MTKYRVIISLLLISILLLACNMPGSKPKELFPTLDLTRTAIVAQATLLTQAVSQPTSTTTSAAPTVPIVIPPTAVPPQPTAVPPQPTAVPVQPTAIPQVPVIPITVIPPTAIPPTAQPQPQPTKAGMVRPGDIIYARYLNTPPSIDGVFDDWATNQYHIPYVNFDLNGKNWSGSSDLSGRYQVGWDEGNLYISVEVVDDVYVQQASGADIYKGDSIEILFDKDLYADFYTDWLTADDFQLGISPGNPNPSGKREAYLWFPRTIAGDRTAKIAHMASSTAGKYVIEAAIPWSVLETTPVLNNGYGLVIGASDNDAPGTAIQQSLISTAKNRSLVNPMTWTQMILIK